MSTNSLPVISQQELEAVSASSADLIQLLISRYREIMASDRTGQMQVQLTLEQYVLMGFNIIDEQVSAGGFIQLIENGFGAFVFDSGLSAHLRSWGMVELASIADRAKVIYDTKKEVLEKEKTLAEFARLYQEHPEFDQLDADFHAVIASERNIMRDHIMAHPNKFAILL